MEKMPLATIISRISRTANPIPESVIVLFFWPRRRLIDAGLRRAPRHRSSAVQPNRTRAPHQIRLQRASRDPEKQL
jgi:hypothetical protein